MLSLQERLEGIKDVRTLFMGRHIEKRKAENLLKKMGVSFYKSKVDEWIIQRQEEDERRAQGNV